MTDIDLEKRRDTLRTAAGACGAVFLLVGILGFVPGVTMDYNTLSWAGHDSNAMLMGIFQVSALHNIVHLAFGVAGLLMSRTPRGARSFLLGGGAIYAVVWIYGLLVDQASGANFLPVNTADNWLHFTLAAGMIALGVALGRRPATADAPRTTVPRQAH